VLKRKHTKVCLIVRNFPTKPSRALFTNAPTFVRPLNWREQLGRKLVLHSQRLSFPLNWTPPEAFCAWTHARTNTRVHSCDRTRALPIQLTHYADVNRHTPTLISRQLIAGRSLPPPNPPPPSPPRQAQTRRPLSRIMNERVGINGRKLHSAACVCSLAGDW
jgi:hypothetical protein